MLLAFKISSTLSAASFLFFQSLSPNKGINFGVNNLDMSALGNKSSSPPPPPLAPFFPGPVAAFSSNAASPLKFLFL